MNSPSDHSHNIAANLPDPQRFGPGWRAISLVAGTLLFTIALTSWLGNPVDFLRDLHADDYAGHAHADGETQWYISGMHPWIVQPEPGNCPVCGMELTPLRPEMLTGSLHIDPQIVQNIGVRVASAELGHLKRRQFAHGVVAPDENRVRKLVLRTEGYIERLYVSALGTPVGKGDLIAEIHSPRIRAAANELLTLLDFHESDHDWVVSARGKLVVMGLTPDQIAAVERDRQVPWTFAVHSPVDGVIQQIHAREGEWLREGGVLLEVVDLSRVWVHVNLFEDQLHLVEPEMEVTLQLKSTPGESLHGKVSFVYPTIDQLTRQGTVRLEFDNTHGRLKPGMFGSVYFDYQSDRLSVLVPREALIVTGPRKLGFVHLGSGRFEPREVVVGDESEGGQVQVLHGIEEGESVVVSGQFLLDSESRLREALLKMIEGEPAISATEGQPEEWLSAPINRGLAAPDEPALVALGSLLEHYLELGEQLVRDREEQLSDHIGRLRESADRLSGTGHSSMESIWSSAASFSDDTAIQQVRLDYEKLGRALIDWLNAFGVPDSWEYDLVAARCPMFPDFGDNGWWLQRDTDVLNPLWGARMLRCFDETIEFRRGNSGGHDHD